MKKICLEIGSGIKPKTVMKELPKSEDEGSGEGFCYEDDIIIIGKPKDKPEGIQEKRN